MIREMIADKAIVAVHTFLITEELTMKNLGYYNGTFGPLEEMTVPMNDRACYFGDGVYDAGLVRDYHVFAMEDHLNRFYGNAEKLDIQVPMPKEELRDLINELVLKLDQGDLFLYYQVTRGTAIRDHTYERGVGNLWITIKPATITDGKKPIGLITTEDQRFFKCNIKTLNLLLNVLAAQKAKDAGCTEAVFYRPGGRVTECAHSNVHILKDGVLHTAPLDELILPGITRAHMLKLCDQMGVPYVEEPFTVEDLKAADEILVTSSTKFCMRADRLDGEPVGGKDLKTFEKIRSALYEEFLEDTKA